MSDLNDFKKKLIQQKFQSKKIAEENYERWLSTNGALDTQDPVAKKLSAYFLKNLNSWSDKVLFSAYKLVEEDGPPPKIYNEILVSSITKALRLIEAYAIRKAMIEPSLIIRLSHDEIINVITDFGEKGQKMNDTLFDKNNKLLIVEHVNPPAKEMTDAKKNQYKVFEEKLKQYLRSYPHVGCIVQRDHIPTYIEERVSEDVVFKSRLAEFLENREVDLNNLQF